MLPNIERMKRGKHIYELHQSGHTYKMIAQELDISIHHLRKDKTSWEVALMIYERNPDAPRIAAYIRADLLPRIIKRSPEYGYA